MAASCNGNETAVVFVVMIGLPAAGKTTLARRIANILTSEDHINVVIVDFDATYAVKKWSAISSTDRLTCCDDDDDDDDHCTGKTTWKAVRRRILDNVSNSLLYQRQRQQQHQRTVVVLDDNNEYREMRHDALSLARRHAGSYVQLYVNVDVDVAVSRDALRLKTGRCVGEDTVRAIASRLEVPSVGHIPWEDSTVVLISTDDDRNDVSIDVAVAAIKDAFLRPVCIPSQHIERHNSDAGIDSSHVDSVELMVRRAIHSTVNQVPSIHRRATAQALAKTKKEFMHMIRIGEYKNITVETVADVFSVHHHYKE